MRPGSRSGGPIVSPDAGDEPAGAVAGAAAEASRVAAALTGRRVVLDCRWLGVSGTGTGRVTELLLDDLRRSPPPGEWVLWGRPERLRPLLFGGAVVAPSTVDPRAWRGQREIARVPVGDVVVYVNGARPLRPGRSVTVIHDTISVRHGGNAATRLAKRLFLIAAARLSTEVITDSAFSRACIERDLGVPPDRITVVSFPQDPHRAAAIARLRASRGQVERLLFVGRFAAHKNLERLCLAFDASRFAARGGTLWLVGGWEGEARAIEDWVRRHGIGGIELRGRCSDAELDELMATSRALVLPSLEEGYGLPAFEAAACGLPVAASRTGAMTDLPPEAAVLFDPLAQDEMTRAIDEATARPARAPITESEPLLGRLVLRAVTRALSRP